MKHFTITITGLCADDVPEDWIYEAAAAAEVQLQEPEHAGGDHNQQWESGGVSITTKIEHRDPPCTLCKCGATTFKFGFRVCPYHMVHGEDDPPCTVCHNGKPVPAIWVAKGDDTDGWYVEGHSDSHGWFCMELENERQVDEQLRELGFTDDQITEAKNQ